MGDRTRTLRGRMMARLKRSAGTVPSWRAERRVVSPVSLIVLCVFFSRMVGAYVSRRKTAPRTNIAPETMT
jgi:hypothetical protein